MFFCYWELRVCVNGASFVDLSWGFTDSCRFNDGAGSYGPARGARAERLLLLSGSSESCGKPTSIVGLNHSVHSFVAIASTPFLFLLSYHSGVAVQNCRERVTQQPNQLVVFPPGGEPFAFACSACLQLKVLILLPRYTIPSKALCETLAVRLALLHFSLLGLC